MQQMLSVLFRDDIGPRPSDDWERKIKEASSQGLLPALRERVASAGAIPHEIVKLLETAESLNGERNQAILDAAVHAASLLNQVGIQPVALKGLAYLVTKTYPNPATRYLQDIDLLLPFDKIAPAVTHLLQNGYYQDDSTFLNFRHHHPAIRREGSPIFELHHQVILGKLNRLLPASQILTNATPLTVESKIGLEACRLASKSGPLEVATFLIPSPTGLVNHLILHSQLAHPYHDRIFPPLRALIDLAHLQTRYPTQIDWHALAATYKKHGQLATLILHLHQAKEILGLPIPEPIPQHLGFFLRLRYQRRALLNRHPTLRFLDPTYLYMSLFSRRLRLLPILLQTPSAWPQLLRLLTRPTFYRNLIR
jgi:hypothetical protein